jgi:DNA-binding CsgD family transcriptional regulator
MSTCCLHDPKTGEHLVLTALRLRESSGDIVGLTLLRADDRFPFHLADLRSAFGFTHTEGRVAYHLLCGCTAEETAQELGVSLETVRTHIKRAYAKLGVSSREGFFHRLAPFVILLA